MEAFSFALEGVSDHLKGVYHRKGVFCHLVDELLQGSQVFFGRLSAVVGEELDQSFLFALEVVGSLLDHVLLVEVDLYILDLHHYVVGVVTFLLAAHHMALFCGSDHHTCHQLFFLDMQEDDRQDNLDVAVVVNAYRLHIFLVDNLYAIQLHVFASPRSTSQIECNIDPLILQAV